MRLVWTKSNLPLSLLIRAITGEDCSHFLFVFDNGIAFESNLLGTHPKFWASDSGFTIVHQLAVPVPQEIEDKIWNKVIFKYSAKPYDYLGALYLGWRTLLKRIFGIAKPKLNAWKENDAFYCDEIYDALDGVPNLPVFNVSGGMETPHEVFARLENYLATV